MARSATPSADVRNVVFTQAEPGHWGPRIAVVHTPVVTVSDGLVRVVTPHPPSPGHFIVSHGVVLSNGVFLGRKSFAEGEQPISEHRLPVGYKGLVTVTSTCNLHDLWVATAEA